MFFEAIFMAQSPRIPPGQPTNSKERTALEYPIYHGLAAALAVMLVGSSFGIPALAFLSELTGHVRQKVFMDKFARQTARLGLVFIISICLSVAGIWTAFIYFPENSGSWLNYELFWNFSLYLCLLSGTLFSLYYFLWDRLKKIKSFHLCLGALAVLSVKLFLALLFWAIYRELLIIPDILPDLDSIFLPILAQIFLISLSAAAVLTLVYLLLRRNRDDYGRDYYRFALGFGAKWAIFFILASPLTCVWLFLVVDNGFDLTYTVIPGAVYAFALIFMAMVLCRIIKSDQPLRNKAAIGLCPILVWIILVFRLVSYLEFMNMISPEPVVHTFVRDWPLLF
jgi:hypothetical protein